MGRYYSGDIEGKFWFAVQDSNDADFFGVEGSEPDLLSYYFEEEDMEGVEEGIAKCLKELGEYKEKFDEFFKDNNGYNNEMIMKEFEIGLIEVKRLLEWYARLELGEKIQKCIKEQGYCEFDAEL